MTQIVLIRSIYGMAYLTYLVVQPDDKKYILGVLSVTVIIIREACSSDEKLFIGKGCKIRELNLSQQFSKLKSVIIFTVYAHSVKYRVSQ